MATALAVDGGSLMRRTHRHEKQAEMRNSVREREKLYPPVIARLWRLAHLMRVQVTQ